MADTDDAKPAETPDDAESPAADDDLLAAGNESHDPSAADQDADPDAEFEAILREGGVAEPLADDAASGEAAAETEADEALEPAGVVAAGGRSGAAQPGKEAKKSRAAREKAAATRKRDEKPQVERTTPITFVRQSVGELRKVVYPTGQQLINYFIVVLVFVLFIIGLVSLLDLGFGWAIFKIFS